PHAASAAPRVPVPPGRASRRYGPFADIADDTGSCGNHWAADTFQRTFTVQTAASSGGTYAVTETLPRGSFVTSAADSPGSCDGARSGRVRAGIRGRLTGVRSLVVSHGKYDPRARCSDADCGTPGDFVTRVLASRA